MPREAVILHRVKKLICRLGAVSDGGVLAHTHKLNIIEYAPAFGTSLVAQMVKNLPAMQEFQETQVQSLGGEDPLEKGMATHSSILDWRIPWTKEPGRPQSLGAQESDTAWQLNHHHHTRLTM